MVSGVYVTGLGDREICDDKNRGKNIDFTLEKQILFNPDYEDIAGRVQISFESHLARNIITQVSYLLVAVILLLMIGHWIVSQYFLRKETEKFTQLSELLRESDFKKLESCRAAFPGEQTEELDDLCNGVEKLSKNWRAYQSELIRNERLLAVNESSRLLAHDIKSPLGAIKTVSQMMLSKPDVSKQLLDKGLARIEKMLFEIVQNEESNTEEITKSPINIQTFMEQIFEEMKLQFDEKFNLTFDFQQNIETGSHSAFVDEELLGRAIRNLIKNSAEAIGENNGKISVITEKNETTFTIAVKDNGPGLPEAVLKQIGEKKLTSTKEGGSGLGIYQVKQAIELHGGKLLVESHADEGSQFTLKFP